MRVLKMDQTEQLLSEEGERRVRSHYYLTSCFLLVFFGKTRRNSLINPSQKHPSGINMPVRVTLRATNARKKMSN